MTDAKMKSEIEPQRHERKEIEQKTAESRAQFEKALAEHEALRAVFERQEAHGRELDAELEQMARKHLERAQKLIAMFDALKRKGFMGFGQA